jgi:uncharacterized protein involved in exopolysaccharide biosynthesis
MNNKSSEDNLNVPPLDLSSANHDHEVSLKELILAIQDWLNYLFSKWLILIFAGIIGGIIGFAYAYTKRPIYKAELIFALEEDKSGGGIGGALGLASQFGFDMGGAGGGAFSGENLIELMKSRSMVEKALLTTIKIKSKEQTLAELYISFNKLRKGWDTKPELKNVQFLPNSDRSTFSLQQDSILGKFYNAIVTNNLTVDKKDKKLSIIAVRVDSENELFSKFFTEALSKEVSDFYVETKTKKSAQNLAILQHQTDSVRRALNSAITGVAFSIDANPNANTAREILRVPSQRRQVDVQANTAILTELVKNLEISKVSLRKETPLIQVIDRPILPLEIEKLGKLKGMLTGGFLAGFLMVLFLIVRRTLKEIMV